MHQLDNPPATGARGCATTGCVQVAMAPAPPEAAVACLGAEGGGESGGVGV